METHTQQQHDSLVGLVGQGDKRHACGRGGIAVRDNHCTALMIDRRPLHARTAGEE